LRFQEVEQLANSNKSVIMSRFRYFWPWCSSDPIQTAELVGLLRSLWQVTARAEAACRSSAAFGCTPASWNTSSISRPAGTRRSRISRRRRSERCAAVLLSTSSGGACPSSRVEGCPLRWAVQACSRKRSAPRVIAAPGSSAGEHPFYPLPIPRSLLIGRCLRLGTGQRVKDAQRRERPEIVEIVGDPPEEALIDFVRIIST
jgi:hypothetical protein